MKTVLITACCEHDADAIRVLARETSGLAGVDVVTLAGLSRMDRIYDLVVLCPYNRESERLGLEWVNTRSWSQAFLVLRGLADLEAGHDCGGGPCAESWMGFSELMSLTLGQIARWQSGETDAVPHGPSQGAGQQAKLGTLTPREMDVLVLTAQGLSISQIAERIHRSENTVASHRRNLHRKLGLENRVELTRFAIKAGLIAP